MTESNPLSRFRHAFVNDSLFRNAALLMSSTAIMSVLGFVFWLFIAHLYTPSQIGIASALISITTLLSNLSLLGLNAGLIRFLPRSKNQSSDINAAMLMVGGVTLLAATLYVLAAGLLGANLGLLTSNLHKIAFIFLMTTVSLNSLTDAVFIANRRAEFHTAAYAVLGLVKLSLPLFLIPLGSLGIFSAYMIAMIASLAFSLFLIVRWCDYHFYTAPNWNLIKQIRAYATHNYLGVVFGGLASQLLPIQIVHRLGSAQAAYFSMAWMMANLLYVIPSAASQSLLAESSFNPAKKVQHIKHTSKILALMLVPAVTVSILIAPYLLSVFGPNYSIESTLLFQTLALSTFFFAACCVGNTIMNIEQRTNGIIIVQSVTSVVAIGLAQFTMSRLRLEGVGLALLGGNFAGMVAMLLILTRDKRPISSGTKKASLPSDAAIQGSLQAYGLEGATVGSDIGGGDRSRTVTVSKNSRKYILKICSAQKHSLQDIAEEIKFTNYLSSHGIPIPNVLPNKSGRMVTSIETDDMEWLVTLTDFKQGFHPSSYTKHILKSMAQTQAAIHNLGIEYASQNSASPTHGKRSIKSLLLPFVPKGFSHFDYYAGNLLTDGRTIVSILDFEGMRYDSIVICIYFTLESIRRLPSSRPADLRTYVRAYEAIRKMGWLERQFIQLIVNASYISKFSVKTARIHQQ